MLRSLKNICRTSTQSQLYPGIFNLDGFTSGIHWSMSNHTKEYTSASLFRREEFQNVIGQKTKSESCPRLTHELTDTRFRLGLLSIWTGLISGVSPKKQRDHYFLILALLAIPLLRSVSSTVILKD